MYIGGCKGYGNWMRISCSGKLSGSGLPGKTLGLRTHGLSFRLIDSSVHWFIGSLVHWFIGSLVHRFRGSLFHWFVASEVQGFRGSGVQGFGGLVVY
jgi:hypothetical protein